MHKFLASPHHPFRLGDFLQQELSKTGWTHFRAAVAFAKRSGTNYVTQAIAGFAGNATISVGIDHGGTTVEAVQDLLTAVGLNGALWIYKNQANTFHPKIFLFHNESLARVAIGSGNLTKGGLFKNAEAGVILDLDLGNTTDCEFFAELRATLDLWSAAHTGICTLVTPAIITALQSSGELITEAQSNVVIKTAKAVGGASVLGTKTAPLFVYAKVPEAPPLPAGSQIAATGAKATATSGPAGVGVGSAVSQKSVAAIPKPVTFGMTLQITDVGVGQTTPGKQARSPEVFIPLKALDQMPAFWHWIDAYTPDHSKFKIDMSWRTKKASWMAGELAKPKRKPRPLDKLDWSNVKVTLNGKPLTVHIGFNPEKKDIRIRHAELRAAGNINDILLMQSTPTGSLHTYDIQVIKKSDPAYVAYLSLLSLKVPSSPKKIGYF